MRLYWDEKMKGSREIKRYVQRNLAHLRAVQWDDLMVILKGQTCKKWYNRQKFKRGVGAPENKF